MLRPSTGALLARRDPASGVAVGIVREHPLDSAPDPVERHDDARSRSGGTDGVVRLVGEERHEDCRHPRRQRAERRPRTAVADDCCRVCEHLSLGNPALDVHVRGHLAELQLSANGQQDADRQLRNRLERAAVDSGGGGK